MAVEKFVDIDEVIKSKNEKLYRWMPNFVLNYIKKIVHEKEVNEILAKLKDDYDYDFCYNMLQHFNVKTSIKGIENIPKEGNVILVANHPLGGMDAMAVVETLSQKRKDIRFIVNDILMNIKNLQGLFVGVNKHGKTSKESFEKVNELFASDKAAFIFPAGMVSRRKKGEVRDLVWKRTFVLKSKEHNTPIIPIFISGELSNFFYNLSNVREKVGIKANIEMFYLINEQFKLRDTNIELTVGKPILPKDFPENKNNHEVAQWIKEQVYLLQTKK